ncbi:MAG: hypothetical protein AAF805_14105 [Planctomycetota bacterium]
MSIALAFTLLAAVSADAPPGGVATDAEEVIRQRDEAGRVRVERRVRIDASGDYVNHGVWRSWDAEGVLLGQGRYAWGKPTGQWTRWATRGDSPLLATAPFDRFEGPFLSQASYRDGKLHGPWTIFGADGRRVSEIAFRDGERHGEAVLWTVAGEVYRRSRFVDGVPTGTLEEQGGDGKLRVLAVYEQGRRRTERVERHENGTLRLRERGLGPLTRQATSDDAWRVRLATYETVGDGLRHGLREAWWPSGQPKLVARYRVGKAIGAARWWHPNGQIALRGDYDAGLADGRWAWWREDGSRAAACRFAAGKPAERWSLWAADGTRLEPTDARVAAAVTVELAPR